MELRFEHGNFDDARIVRTRVFMEEQGFQDEFDDIDDDPRTIHVTLYDANALVGCARTFPDPDRPDQPGRWVFGRLAVLPEARRGGFGAALLAESERLAREAGATEMHLHAQCRVTPFYGRMATRSTAPSSWTSTSSTSGWRSSWMRQGDGANVSFRKHTASVSTGNEALAPSPVSSPPRLIPAREKGSPAEAGDPRNASVHCGYATGCTLTRCPG